MADSRPLVRFLSRDDETKDTHNLDDLDCDEPMPIRFAHHHFGAAPIRPVNYEYTTDKADLLIGGASYERKATT